MEKKLLKAQEKSHAGPRFQPSRCYFQHERDDRNNENRWAAVRRYPWESRSFFM